MNISRRAFFKIAALSALAIAIAPRAAVSSAVNRLVAIRTGKQPNGRTRLVIETSRRPSHGIAYPDGNLRITLRDTSGTATPTLVANTLVSGITSSQSGSSVVINATLTHPVREIPKSQTMILSPGGSNKNFRLVLDFEAGGAARAGVAPAAASAPAAPVRQVAAATGRRVIVIDAGHGGKDPGAIGRGGTKEKDVVLRIARKLRDNLSGNYTVHMTRDRDVFLNLNTRSALAEQHRADMFISLHANANRSRDVKGFSVFTLSDKASDTEAQRIAEAENAADRIAVDDFQRFEIEVRHILSSLQQTAFEDNSRQFGHRLNGITRSKGIQLQENPLRHAPFAVLRASTPAVLVELGHLSNRDEERLLNTNSHQDKLVAALRKAIDGFEFLV